MGRPRSIHERSSRCTLLAAPASMTARLDRSSREQCLAFTVAQLNFRKDSLREALNIPVRHQDVTPRLPGVSERPPARIRSVCCCILPAGSKGVLQCPLVARSASSVHRRAIRLWFECWFLPARQHLCLDGLKRGLNDCHRKEATSSNASEGRRPPPVVVERHRDTRTQGQ